MKNYSWWGKRAAEQQVKRFLGKQYDTKIIGRLGAVKV